MADLKNKSESRIFLFLFIQLLSLVGSNISHVAIGFWIYNKTHSVTDFSLVLFFSFLPNILSSFLSGPIVDRFHFNKTFGIGDIISAAIMLLTTAVVMINAQTFLYLYATIFAVSAVSALQWVSLNAYLPEVLKDESLARATGWLSTATSMAGLLAAALASLLISTIGLKYIFIFDAATFLISAYVVFYLLPKDKKETATFGEGATFISDFKAGFNYLKSKKDVFTLVMMFIVFNFFAGINTNLMTPMFLERYSVKYAGYLLGFLGFGSIIAGLAQTGITRLAKLRHYIPLLMLFIFIENILIGYFPAPFLTALFMFTLGANITLVGTSTTLVLQENVKSEYRGRVFATARGLCWIAIPLAQIICGIVTDNIFKRFFTELSKNAYLGNTFLIVNYASTLLFLGYLFREKIGNLKTHVLLTTTAPLLPIKNKPGDT